jgi:hypothetical protein
MRTYDGALNDGVLVISVAGQMGKYRHQDTALRPAAESPMHVFPIAEPL